MAPLPDDDSPSFITEFIKRSAAKLTTRTNTILPRSTTVDPSVGVTPPDAIPNKFIFILIGLICAGFVVTGVWFFFRAKNGGFYFHDNDWEDYKSTVLRRKGPNGTTLSGATECTDLGGGSVVHGEKRWRRKHKGGRSRYQDFDEDEGSTVTGNSEMSELKWQAQQEAKRGKRGLRGGDLGVGDEESVIDAVRAYRHEKPARVGGINKEPDGSHWDGSSDAQTDLLSHREKTPTNTPTKVKKERRDTYTGGTGGIRKVMPSTNASTTASSSFWSRSSAATPKKSAPADEDHIKAEARKLQEKGRAAQRRDFSFSQGDDSTVADEAEERRARREERRARRRAERESLVPGSYAESSVGGSEVSETGTKSYHHVIPGLSTMVATDFAGDRRKKRNGGYRRGGTGSDAE